MKMFGRKGFARDLLMAIILPVILIVGSMVYWMFRGAVSPSDISSDTTIQQKYNQTLTEIDTGSEKVQKLTAKVPLFWVIVVIAGVVLGGIVGKLVGLI